MSPARLALVAGAGLVAAACGSKPAPLPPELAAVNCPKGHAAHAAATFGKARVTFVCISPELADTPYLLRCDRESRPMICEDAGSLVFSRRASGEVYIGTAQGLARPAAEDLEGGSHLIVNFHAGPPRTETFAEEETDWRFLLKGARDLLPEGFVLVKGALCDRKTTVLNTGICNLEATTPSLYWHVSVAIHAPRGTPVFEEEYREALRFWLGHLGQLVRDPAR